MATRATYEVDGKTFYCHWDGYPEGAASRFIKMVEAMSAIETDHCISYRGALQGRSGGAQFAFIRGNMDAEPAHPGGHGDTEWHYTVWTSDKGRLHIHWKTRRSGDDEWTACGIETLATFCNRYGAEWRLPKLVEMRREVHGGERYTIATQNVAEAAAKREAEIAELYPHDNPNHAQHMKAAAAWSEALRLDAIPA